MVVSYNSKTDLLYLSFDSEKHNVINKRVNENIVVDIDENDKIVGIEILDASTHIKLEKILPLESEIS
jgi:uncharacterized protein YuzE